MSRETDQCSTDTDRKGTGVICQDCPYQDVWHPVRTERDKCKHDLVHEDHTVDYVDADAVDKVVRMTGEVLTRLDEQATLMTDGGTEQTVVVDDELEEAVHWVERELREARRALWDGQSGRAFASIEAAQDEFEKVEEAILESENRYVDTDISHEEGQR